MFGDTLFLISGIPPSQYQEEGSVDELWMKKALTKP